MVKIVEQNSFMRVQLILKEMLFEHLKEPSIVLE